VIFIENLAYEVPAERSSVGCKAYVVLGMTNTLVGKAQGEKIWTNGEMSVIAAAILCVVCDNKKRPEYQNLTNVYWFVAEMWCDRKVA
jgi:hypothetical protein